MNACYLGAARFVKVLYVRSPFKLLRHRRAAALVINDKIWSSLDLHVHFKQLCPGAFNWFPVRTYWQYTYTCIATINSCLSWEWHNYEPSALAPKQSVQLSRIWQVVTSTVELINHYIKLDFQKKSHTEGFANPVTISKWPHVKNNKSLLSQNLKQVGLRH